MHNNQLHLCSTKYKKAKVALFGKQRYFEYTIFTSFGLTKSRGSEWYGFYITSMKS